MRDLNLDSAAAFVDVWRRGHRLPGIAMVAVSGAGSACTHCLGVASRATSAPVTSSTGFELGPTASALTAEGILILTQRGAIRLDDQVNRHLPWIKSRCTILQLLSSNGKNPTGHDSELTKWTEQMPLAEWVRCIERSAVPKVLRLGSPSSGSAYAILGALIEAVSGQTFPDFMHDNIFLPLAMHQTTARADDLPQDMVADGHYLFDSSATLDPVPISIAPAYAPVGGIVTSAADIGRYLETQLDSVREGVELASPLVDRGVAATVRKSKPTAGAQRRIGWVAREFHLGTETLNVFEREGLALTFSSAFVIVPSRDIAVALLVNAPTVEVADMARAVIEHLIA